MSPSSPASHPRTQSYGVVHGQILRPPGRDPRSGHAAAGQVPVNGDTVHAFDREGRRAASAVSGSGGRFEFVLPPGTYRVTEGICGVSRQVEVRSRETTSLTLTIPNSC